MTTSVVWGADWSLSPVLVIPLLLGAGFYLRGFRQIRIQSPEHFPGWRRNFFLAGLLILFAALASPLDAVADMLLFAHMVQHWLLMMVIPPLIWLGAPVVPVLRGLPRPFLIRGLGPLLSSPSLRRFARALTHPVTALAIWIFVTLAWHWAPAYQLALGSRTAHDFEHLSFLAASLLLWFRILEPWPVRNPSPFAARLLLVAAAGIFNSLFSAGFAFSSAPFYGVYAEIPNPWAISALEDQAAAGAFMWIGGSLCMIGAAVGIALAGLSPARLGEKGVKPRPPRTSTSREFSLWTGWISSRGLRRGIQWGLAGLALLVMLDGFFGPQVPSAENLAGVLPWTYWRGLAVITLVVAGNLSCAVCPLTLSRGVAARLFGRPFRWPSILRNKWLPAGLFVFYLWSYEILELWDRPGATAAWIAAFFVLCFLVEGLFQRGTFCRHICPVGQFQFIHSGLSPGEVQPLSKAVCSACTTHDCLRGNADGPGCPTELFLPAKSGNMDCTFCLDCVRACPHQNAALVPVVPGKSLGQGRVAGQSSGLDAAVLSLVFVCGAFVNAMFMSAPFMTGQRALSAQLGLHDSTWLSSMSLVSGMVVVPLIVFPLCAGVGRRISGADRSIAEMLRGFAPALVPLGFAMWLAHLGFHFMTGVFTGVSAGQRAMHDLFSQRFDLPGIAKAPGLAWIADFQLWALGLGLVLSIAVLWRVAREFVAEPGRALRLVIPWSMVAVLLWGLGVFIVLSPMAMRGTVM